MALVVSSPQNSSAADPTVSLKAALASFENILTAEQKRQYNANPTKPDTASVIAFIAQVDANNQGRARRCVASRLCTFLDATQQFTGVVETFVSSHPTIAALVWGGVKTAILTASNIASYFDKVTGLIMAISKFCPTYQQFGQLYPGCVGLQNALCEYYAIVVRLCVKIIEIERRTAISQIVSSVFSPFESEFKAFIDELQQAAEAVKLQVTLASKQAAHETAKLVKLESKENETHRRMAVRFRSDVRKEHDEARQWRLRKVEREAARMKSSIRENLSTINHIKPWKQALQQRAPDTAEWFQQEPAFHDWRNDKETAILWCPGTMGVGKTILMSNVVAHLHASRKQSDIISYYFCRSDHEASLQARDILGSLAYQLLNAEIGHAKDGVLTDMYNQTKDIDTKDIIDFILAHLKEDKTHYIIIDGIDECESGEVRMLAQSMTRLCQKWVKNLKIIYASRPELEGPLFKLVKPKYKIALTKAKNEADMKRYIDTTLDQCLEDEWLTLSDPQLILKITEALQEGSDGM